MSGGDWSKFLKDRGGLIGALFVVSAFTICVIELNYLEQRFTYGVAARNAANYAEDAKNDVAVKCRGLVGQALDDCSDKIDDAARENQRNEYDLAAQRTMAIWTSVMGWMAVLGVGLSGVGIYLIWTTFKETQRTAEIAEWNFNAYQHAERGFALLVEAAVNASRSILDSDPCMFITAQNTGRTPIIIKRIRCGWRTDLKEWGWPPEHDFEGVMTCYCKPDGSAELWGMNLPISLPDRIFVLGFVLYDTLGMKDRKSHFIAMIDTFRIAVPERSISLLHDIGHMPEDT